MKRKKTMRILAIETSCDETAAAVLECSGTPRNASFKMLSNIVSSQIKIHAPWGGVVPNLARREHEKNLVPVTLEALQRANIKLRPRRGQPQNAVKIIKILEKEHELQDHFLKKVQFYATPEAIDAVAVTTGPGLEPALWTGINFAKALALLWKKPLISVNHLEGHIISAVMRAQKFSSDKVLFPALALIVSGGHTEIVLMRRPLNYEVIGQTRDDAAGEAFDKAAKLLGLGYPGGPEISRRAKLGNPKKIILPRPMIKSSDFDFSFSGLKTAVLYSLQKEKSINRKKINDYAASFEEAAVEVLVQKTLRATDHYSPETILLGGGVSANRKLRRNLQTQCRKKFPGKRILMPQIQFTGDNAAMIAAAGYLKYSGSGKFVPPQNLRAQGSLAL